MKYQMTELQTTTLRQLIKEDIDLAFSLKLCVFNDYERNDNLLTTAEHSNKFDRSKGFYGPYPVQGIHKGLLDLPLYIGECLNCRKDV